MSETYLLIKQKNRRWLWYGASLLVVLALLLFIPQTRQAQQIASPADKGAPATPKQEVTLACPGRIEAVSETVKVGAGIDGLLKAVLVREGEQVRAGQEIAIIDRADLEAERQAALAAAESARQTRARLLRGSRTEERRVAASQTIAAEARLIQARQSFARTEKLFQSGDISAETHERIARDLRVAEAAMAAATDQEKLVNAEPLPEELAKIEADIKGAEERLRNISERLKRCSIKAPISGSVLRVHVKPGEMVTTVFPQPILSIADTSVWRSDL